MRGAAVLLVFALIGCRSAQTDLSRPCRWEELDASPVPVVVPDACLPIVTTDAPDEKWAAVFLASVIEKTCGRRPDVFVETAERGASFTNGLFVGNVSANRGWTCPLSNESADAFRVVADNGCVRFLGRADYAVFDWCERELDFRYYCADGMCPAHRTEIVARAVDYSDRPVFECRQSGAMSDPWVRFSKTGNSHRGGVNVHAPSRWYADKGLKAESPEIFESGETPMLCYGNPKTLEYYKRRIDRQIAGLEDSGGIVNTNRKIVTVCQWDAPIACTCSVCRVSYDGESASPIIWGRFLTRLAAWLADEHPDYMISFLPYLNTCELPRAWIAWRPTRGPRGVRRGRKRVVRSPLAPEIAEAEPCTMPGLAMLKNEACRRKEEQILRDWHRATGRKVLNWHYGCWPLEWTSAPYVFGKTIQRHYADMSGTSCGTFVCGGDGDPRTDLSMYVWRRCLWNPDVDVDALYDEFARRMFGCAAQPMRACIALQEACWNRQWEDNACTVRNVFETSFPREDAVRMESLLKEAYWLARKAGDDRAKRRIMRYASGLELFLDESSVLARRQERKILRPGETLSMVDARSAARPTPWAKTSVTTSVADGALCIRVVCAEPAVAKMDFSHRVKDYVWGNDCLAFVWEGAEGKTQHARVYLTGEIERKGHDAFSASVSHDGKSWTVEARLKLSDGQVAANKVLGNVTRWRVGDMCLPKSERVPESRYEWSRLDTRYTRPNDDPAAFVEFRLR